MKLYWFIRKQILIVYLRTLLLSKGVSKDFRYGINQSTDQVNTGGRTYILSRNFHNLLK